MYARSIALLFVICFFFFWAKYCFFRYCFFCGAKVRQVYLLKDWSGTWISSISRFGKSLCFLLWTQNLAFLLDKSHRKKDFRIDKS